MLFGDNVGYFQMYQTEYCRHSNTFRLLAWSADTRKHFSVPDYVQGKGYLEQPHSKLKRNEFHNECNFYQSIGNL